jgi:hypothetical protein
LTETQRTLINVATVKKANANILEAGVTLGIAQRSHSECVAGSGPISIDDSAGYSAARVTVST